MFLSSLVKNILAVSVGILAFLVLEGTLALVGVARLADEDRFVGFAGSTPLFLAVESEATGARFKLNPAKDIYFNPQTFLMPKPQSDFRLVSLGGSTTYGRPYLGETAFSRWLELLCNEYDGTQGYEAINAGGISYASYRAARLQKELINYDPNLFIVYSGHNEFLEARTFANLKDELPWLNKTRQILHHSRIYSLLSHLFAHLTGKDSRGLSVLPDEVSAELESIAGPDFYHRDDVFRRGVLKQYRASIQGMIDLAREHNVPLVLCTLPSNLSDVSPFKSEHDEGLTGRELKAWSRLFAKGNLSLRQGDAEMAAKFYREAMQIDNRYALLHFRLGHALLASDLREQAYQSFVRAKQEDIIPLRALEEMNTIVRELAGINDVALADVAATFRRVAWDGIPGADLFDDHVHPNIRGQQLIAWIIFEAMVTAQLLPLSEAEWQGKLKEARQRLLELENQVPVRYRALGVWGVGRLYFWAGKYPEAYEPLKQAWAQIKDVPEIPLKLGALEVFRGDGNAALPLLEAALRLEPDNPDVMVMLANAHLLLKQGREALVVLSGLPAGGEMSSGFLSAQGRALMLVGEQAVGLETLRRALALAPEAPRTVREYAEALATAGKMQDATLLFRRYLQLVRAPDVETTLQGWIEQKGWQTPRQWLGQEPGLQ